MLIAGVRIGTIWHGGLAPRDVLCRGYEEFLSDPSAGLPDIRVEVHPMSAVPSRPSPARKIFDSGQSWLLYRDGTDYWLSLDPPFHDEDPVWLTKFDPPVTQVEVFLNVSGGIEPDDPVRYPLDQFLVVYHLGRRSGLLLHAAGAVLEGAAVVFAGRSQAGKSTLSRQLQNDEQIELLSDDRIVVRSVGGTFHAFGTPWPGEAGIARNNSAPLCSLLFLNQSSVNRVEPISPQRALEKLLPITSIPWYEKQLFPEFLDTCEELLKQIPACDLHFRPDTSVLELLHDLLKHEKRA